MTAHVMDEPAVLDAQTTVAVSDYTSGIHAAMAELGIVGVQSGVRDRI
jgi:hypothetical protein